MQCNAKKKKHCKAYKSILFKMLLFIHSSATNYKEIVLPLNIYNLASYKVTYSL